ncbi:MAG: pyridoxamine kinase [Spirochaetaceae bacterium]|nr:pyridoxamine kinase [Spirochaetaceae bacterium]MCF7948804.1 pyridoxamine kinase [Spirochaetia bacterium]MCF7950465.1 pyridoxamine kinase [Spirochaetaceae bacterium]
MRKPVPRAAAIHDLSGFGRSSLTIILPVLSTMGVQVCPLPTALLSTHTGGFENYTFLDLTEQMGPIAAHWKQLEVDFDAIYSGFLGSSAQVEIVRSFIDDFRTDDEDQLIMVDPVLGDDGELYGPFNAEMVEEMRRLVEKADIITPNITEASFLLNTELQDTSSHAQLKQQLLGLSEMGPRMVVMTSVKTDGKPDVSTVVAYDRQDGRFWKIDCDYVPAFYPGTGDLFASVLVGSLLQGDSLPIAIERSVQFVSISIRATFGHRVPHRDGVLFERVLGSLSSPLTSSTYQVLE